MFAVYKKYQFIIFFKKKNCPNQKNISNLKSSLKTSLKKNLESKQQKHNY